MTALEDENVVGVDEPAELDDPVEPAEKADTDVTLRTEVILADGSTIQVREKWSTVTRYVDKAVEKNACVRLSTSPSTRVSFRPEAFIRALELVRA